MKKQRVWSQGDLVLIEETIPKEAEEIEKHDGVLAYGEVTGHCHRIIKGEVRFFRNGNVAMAYALTDLQIGHEDHPNITIPTGTKFRYGQEREADWFEEVNRNVAD